MTLLAQVAEFPYSAEYREELRAAGEDTEAVMSAAYDGVFLNDLSSWCAAVLAMHDTRKHRRLIDGLLSGDEDPMDAYDEVDAAVSAALGEARRNGPQRRTVVLRNAPRSRALSRTAQHAPPVEVMPPGARGNRVIDDAAARYAGAPLHEGGAIMEESYNVADEMGWSVSSMDHRQWQQVAREAWRRIQASRLPEERPRLRSNGNPPRAARLGEDFRRHSVSSAVKNPTSAVVDEAFGTISREIAADARHLKVRRSEYAVDNALSQHRDLIRDLGKLPGYNALSRKALSGDIDALAEALDLISQDTGGMLRRIVKEGLEEMDRLAATPFVIRKPPAKPRRR